MLSLWGRCGGRFSSSHHPGGARHSRASECAGPWLRQHSRWSSGSGSKRLAEDRCCDDIEVIRTLAKQLLHALKPNGPRPGRRLLTSSRRASRSRPWLSVLGSIPIRCECWCWPDPHVLITGASSGIGLEAAGQLAARGHRLTLVCRDSERCASTQQQLIEAGAAPDRLAGIAADLADLASVERVCQRLLDQGQPIDALVLNAGQQRAGASEPVFSPQGIEITFAVNQLAHQLMASRLLPLLRAGKQPRLVITASDVHDPATGGGKVGQPADLGDLAGLRAGRGFVMLDGSARFDGDKAYKTASSATCCWPVSLPISWRALPVIAWSPNW